MCDPCCSPCCGTCGPYGPCSDECCSRELRAGIMYTNCDCWKRNGLQDQCPRSLCKGRCCGCSLFPGCCPSSYPLRFAYMTHGLDKRMRNPCCPRTPCCY